MPLTPSRPETAQPLAFQGGRSKACFLPSCLFALQKKTSLLQTSTSQHFGLLRVGQNALAL